MCKRNLAVLIILFTGFLHAHAQTLKFRTDGYYFYDNKIDTIRVYKFPEPTLLAEARKMLKDEYDVSGEQELTCLMKNEVPEGGKSTLMHVMTFFTDTTGTAFDLCCRDIATYQSALEAIQKRRAGLDKRRLAQSQAIFSIRWFGKNEFSLLVGQTVKSQEIYHGKLYRDSMIVKVIQKMRPSIYDPNEARVYKFYRFGEVPHVAPQVIVRQ